MAHLSEQDRVALRARERFLESAGRVAEPVPVRPEIAASWLRSMERTVDPSAPAPDFHRVGETRLSAAALPVINHYVEALGDTRTSLLFADVHGRLIGRWSHDNSLRTALSGSFVEAGFTMAEGVVGTNGVGTVLEAGRPVEVKGAEHYSDYYLDFTCVGAPIRDPLTGRIIGVIDITSRIDETSTLAMPWITHLARQIESQLLDEGSHAEKALLNAYLLTARRSRNAVLALNGDLAIGNAEATGTAHPARAIGALGAPAAARPADLEHLSRSRALRRRRGDDAQPSRPTRRSHRRRRGRAGRSAGFEVPSARQVATEARQPGRHQRSVDGCRGRHGSMGRHFGRHRGQW